MSEIVRILVERNAEMAQTVKTSARQAYSQFIHHKNNTPHDPARTLS